MANLGSSRLITRLSPANILLLAAIVRAIWIFACPNEPTSDQTVYHSSATFLAEGKGYVDESGQPANYWPVGYSAFLAPFYWAFGSEPSSAFIANFVLGLIMVLGVYLLGRELFDEDVGRIAGALAAVYPTFVFYTTCIASENAYVPGMLWTMWLGVRAARAQRAWPWAIAAGAVFALACYVRATVVFLVPMLVLLLWLPRKRIGDVVLRGGVIAVTALALLMPWALRNQHHFGALTPFSINGGANFWMGNHAGGTGEYVEVPKDVGALPLRERDRELMRRGLLFVKENPARYVKLSVLRAVTTLRSDTSGVGWNEVGLGKRLGHRVITPLKALNTLAHYALLLLALTRIGQQIRRRAWSLPDTVIAGSLLAMSVPFVLIVSGNRYQLPLIPFLIVWAAAVFVQWRPVAARAASPVVTA